MWDDLLSALALVFVLEGLFPFLSPAGFRNRMLALMEMSDQQIRTISIISMLVGLGLLYLVRN